MLLKYFEKVNFLEKIQKNLKCGLKNPEPFEHNYFRKDCDKKVSFSFRSTF